MPEFRFRRKKPGQKAFTNTERAVRGSQQAATKELVKPVVEPAKKVLMNGVGREKMVAGVGVKKGRRKGEELSSHHRHRNETRSSFVQEREKFFELLKAKYPEQASSLEVGVAGMEEGMGVAGAGDLTMFRNNRHVVSCT